MNCPRVKRAEFALASFFLARIDDKSSRISNGTFAGIMDGDSQRSRNGFQVVVVGGG
jgi:hypothetical protein